MNQLEELKARWQEDKSLQNLADGLNHKETLDYDTYLKLEGASPRDKAELLIKTWENE